MGSVNISHTTVLTLTLPCCTILAVDFRVCNGGGGVVSDRYDKLIQLRPSIFLACFGDCHLIDQVRDALANLPANHKFIGEIAHLVQNTVNTVVGNSRDDEGEINRSVEFVLLGRSLLDKRYYFYKISKGTNTWMYFARREVGKVATAGCDALRTFLEENNLDENKTEEEAVDYAFRCVEYAAETAWVSGGRIQVVVMKPGSSIVHAWEPNNPRYCRSGYHYLEPRISEGY